MVKDLVQGAKEAISPEKQCCFCAKEIDKSALVDIDLDLGDNQHQQLAAHGLCLRHSLHNSVPFFAPEEDVS